MLLDDPQKPEFVSVESYYEFARRVRHGRRYVWPVEVQVFLDTVLATLKDRDVKIREGSILYRAQLGIDHVTPGNNGDEITESCGYDKKRMKPLVNCAREGRVNPVGIPVLYLSNMQETAVSEVRPWIGSDVSLAKVRVLRDLNTVDLSKWHDFKSGIFGLTFDEMESCSSEAKQKAVLIDIDCAFSQPVMPSDDQADYVPTKILSELFRSVGYDAIIYRSNFGEEGYNIALFNVDDADVISCAPFSVEKIETRHVQIGNFR